MKSLLMVALFASAAFGEGVAADRIARSVLFTFHDNPWLNEHHFLYHIAKHEQDERVLDGLDGEDRKRLQGAIEYYREQVIERDLLFDAELYRLKRWLVRQPLDSDLPPREELPRIVVWLNRVRPLFDSRFRPDQQAQNFATVERHLRAIRDYEVDLAARLARLSRSPWPDEPIRVDVSFYTNWAGAYTTVRPELHIVIRSRDDGPPGDWIETLFHEASHGLIGGRSGPVADTIARVSEELGRPAPKGLWHGILFYIAGRVVEDRLTVGSEEDYELYMVRESVYDDYYPLLVSHFEPYLEGEIDLDTAVRRTIEGIDDGDGTDK